MESLDWSKKFEVLSISRLDLSAYGLPTEQINALTDEDMEHIAEELYHRYDLNNFGEDVVFVARLVLAEKRKEEQGDYETDLDRGWNAIRSVGSRSGVARTPTRGEEIMQGMDICASYSDIQFMECRGIPCSVRQTNWVRLS